MNLSKKTSIILLILIILLQVIFRIYIGTKKEYFHMDEAYSYGLMNYDKLSIVDNSDFLNTWHNKEYYLDYFEVNSKEAKNIGAVFENQKNDVHPPLYYLLLRISASFTIDNFTKWTGLALNMIIFAVSSVFVYLLSKKIFKKDIYALLVTLVNGFTLRSLDSAKTTSTPTITTTKADNSLSTSDIINIILIAVCVVLIFLAIAILIRCK